MSLKHTEYYKKLSAYQKSIVDMMINGCKADCTEGKNYKVWIIEKSGLKKIVRKDSASIIFSTEALRYFYINDSGITLKQRQS